MKIKSQNSIIMLSFTVVLLLLVSCRSQEPSGNNPKINGLEDNILVNFEADSIHFSQEELLKEADLIFAGRVLDISPTRWNQDNGEYWTETTNEGMTAEGTQLTTTHSAWPVYEVRLAVTQSIVNEVEATQEVVVTLLGKSPIEAAISDTANGIQVDAETVNLQIGQELVVFAIQTELAWRDPNRPIELITNPDGVSYFDIGKRTIVTLMGVPANAYLLKGSDDLYYHSEEATNRQEPLSLDSLIEDISKARGILDEG